MNLDISILLDQASVAALGRIKGVNVRLAAELETALDGTASDLETAIPDNMHWQNGTGALAGSFTTTSSPLQREIGSEHPYARRREFSFKGPDSLGRMFPHDPAGWYAQTAIEQIASGSMLDRFGQAIDAALAA